MTKSVRTVKIKKFDWILIFGLVLAPMTGLRIMHVGPGELLTFIWCLRYLFRFKLPNNIISKFFIPFLFSMFLGTVWCQAVSPAESAIAHWPTWIFLAFAAFAMYDELNKNELEYNEYLFKTIVFISAVWFFALFIYGNYVSRTFLGAPLWYYNRFTGGADNPHQFAILMCGMVFCFVRYALKRQNVLLNIALTAISVFLLLKTQSSTGVAAIVISALVCFGLFVSNMGTSITAKRTIISLEIVFVIIFVMFFHQKLYVFLYDWVASDSNGLERFYLFSNIKNTFVKSPIFGLGPGNHTLTVSGNPKEYHNMYLEILAASGLIGVVAFIRFTVQLIRKIRIDYTLVPILISIFAYGVGGFALRRLPFWEMIVFILVIAEQINYRLRNLEKI